MIEGDEAKVLAEFVSTVDSTIGIWETLHWRNKQTLLARLAVPTTLFACISERGFYLFCPDVKFIFFIISPDA